MNTTNPHTNPSEPPDPPGPRFLGRFRVERPLGSGGMGEVLLAHDELLNRRVALKRMSYGDDRTKRRKAALHEARRASQVNDRRIAAIFDVLELDDELLIVMEYVEGTTLRRALAQPMSLETFWRLAPQCLEAFGAAHAHGIVHRDIKPENVMVTPNGEIKILDFGIAKRTEGALTTTTWTDTSTRFAGTPSYMPPEAHLGEPADERSDLYSLGVVFYEMLGRRLPFTGTAYASLLNRILNEDPAPLETLNPDVGTGLSRVIARMLAKQPDRRYASCADVLRDLEQVRTGGAPADAAAEEATTVPAVPARRRFDRRYAMYAAGAVLLVAAGALWWRGAVTGGIPRDRNLAILAPTTAGGDADGADRALGLVDLVADRLRPLTATPGFQLTPLRETIDGHVTDVAGARQILGANLVLTPILTLRPDAMEARLELADAVRGRTLATRTIEGPASEPFSLLNRVYAETVTMLGLEGDTAVRAPDWGVHGAGTLRFYLQGTGRTLSAGTGADARKAVEDLETACRTEPESAVALAALAAAQFKVHLLERDPAWLARAEESARDAVALDSTRAGPHRILGMVLTAKRDRAGARAELEIAAAADPYDDDVVLELGRTYARLGMPEREREVYEAAITRRPHAWPPHWWLATWHFREGDVEAATREFEEMIRRAPHLNKGYSSLGGLLVLRGDYPRAIETLEHSIALNPTKVAFDNLGTAYFNSGRFDMAIDAYNQSFQFGFADYESWLNLGDAYFWLRDRRDQAAEAYRQAVRLGREEMRARARSGRSVDVMIPANLATVFPKLGAPDSARFYLRRALDADSLNPMVTYCAALTLWQLSERDRAVAWLERSVRGGYPVVWLRDSPIFEDWREVPAFRALVGDSTATAMRAASGR